MPKSCAERPVKTSEGQSQNGVCQRIARLGPGKWNDHLVRIGHVEAGMQVEGREQRANALIDPKALQLGGVAGKHLELLRTLVLPKSKLIKQSVAGGLVEHLAKDGLRERVVECAPQVDEEAEGGALSPTSLREEQPHSVRDELCAAMGDSPLLRLAGGKHERRDDV